MMLTSRLLLSVSCVLMLCLSFVAAHPRHHHRGVLNRRLTNEQMQEKNDDIPMQWLTQKLDHNDLASSATWQQLYYVNATFFNPAAPVFFLTIGGEGPISPSYVTDHFITGTLAQEHSAMNVALEHRFYGQSIPNNDSSTHNLRLLSSAQALEDLVTFRSFITAQYAKNSPVPPKWILFGGSYSGAMSAWGRLKYPNLFQGSYAASGPVEAELDFSQYFEVVSASVGPTCSAVIAGSTATVTSLLSTPTGRAQMQTDFNLCAPIADVDVSNFLASLSGPIAEVVQYNDDKGIRTFDIPIMCAALEGQSSAYAGLKNLWTVYNAHTNVTACTDVSYANMIAGMNATSDARSWTYQTCIEFGYFQTGDSNNQPFSPLISLDYYVQQCEDIFGVQGLTPNIDWTLEYYGGSEIVTSNTVFTNGDVDPWHKLGNYQEYDASSMSASILMHGTAHCADLYASEKDDLPILTQTRTIQDGLLTQWLAVQSTHDVKVLTEQ